MSFDIPSFYSTEDKVLILRAHGVAKRKHQDQKRDSGEPYITHPEMVSHILMSLEVMSDVVAAGMLHDVLEDTNESFRELEDEFGFEVAKIVNSVTKTKKMEQVRKDHPEEKRKALHHYFLENIRDPRAALVKISDRLSNMRTIEFVSGDRKIANAEETVRMYIPLADELGARIIAEELDEICMKILAPEDYTASHEAAKKYRREIEEKGYHKDKLFECVIQKKL